MLDSRSYFFMTSATSCSVPVSGTAAACFFKKLIVLCIPFIRSCPRNA
ncbi:secreted protein [gut metagenome]|uniref:Secreted protein n=1 Tax=gut metagenome TaxID=749906 RepID=J9G4Y3_9ZZZZ